MGMFDYVNYECACPVCQTKVYNFQSKDGDLLLDTVEPAAVNNFYSACDKCGSWIDFTAKNTTGKTFTRTVTGENYKCLHEHTKDVKIG